MQQHHQASFEDLPIDEDYRTPRARGVGSG